MWNVDCDIRRVYTVFGAAVIQRDWIWIRIYIYGTEDFSAAFSCCVYSYTFVLVYVYIYVKYYGDMRSYCNAQMYIVFYFHVFTWCIQIILVCLLRTISVIEESLYKCVVFFFFLSFFCRVVCFIKYVFFLSRWVEWCRGPARTYVNGWGNLTHTYTHIHTCTRARPV